MSSAASIALRRCLLRQPGVILPAAHGAPPQLPSVVSRRFMGTGGSPHQFETPAPKRHKFYTGLKYVDEAAWIRNNEDIIRMSNQNEENFKAIRVALDGYEEALDYYRKVAEGGCKAVAIFSVLAPSAIMFHYNRKHQA